MKTKLLLLLLFLTAHLSLLTSQVPQGFNYQAIARDGSGNPITGAPIQVRLTLQSDSAGTQVIWQELHSSVTTNSFGLFTLVLGRGTRQSGSALTFDAINWSVTPVFVKTEVNYGGWKDMGTTRLWSVPYAMRAGGSSQWQTSGSDIFYAGGKVGIWTNTPQTALTVTENTMTGITYPLYIQNASGDWSAAEKGVGLKFGRLNPTSGHDYGTIRGTIASGSGGEGRLQFIGGGGTDPHVTINYLGNVGIGTAGPSQKLEIGGTGSAIYLNSSTSNFLMFNTAGVNPPTFTTRSVGTKVILFPGISSTQVDFAIGISSGSNWYSVPQNISAYAHRFYAGTTELFTISGNGNVGIGTVSPGFKLDVVGRSRIQSGGGDAGIWLMDNTNVSNRSFIGMMGNDHVGLYGAGGIGWGLVMNVNSGNIGIGSTAPSGKMVIQPPASWDDNIPLFEVKNKSGVTVFAVYNNGVRAFVQTNSGKAVKGGFAIGGFDPSKAGNVQLMNISPDSIRFYIDNSTTKATKGGFAIGSFNTSKAPNQDFMYLTPQSSGNGQYNTFLGYQTGTQTSASTIPDYGKWNSFIGYQAGYSNKYGYSNVFIGYRAGFSNYGPTTLGTLGVNNVYIGTQAGVVNLGSNNILMGDDAGKLLTGGNSNVYIGSGSGRTDVNGDYNTYLGAFGGKDETGSDNVMIGYAAGFGSGESNLLVIGNRNNNALISGYFNTKKLFLWADVGIGTSSPLSKLHVSPGQITLNGTTNPYVGLNDGTRQGYIEITSNVLALTYTGVTRLAISTTGLVGIGTPTPGQKLDISAGNGRVQTGYSWLTNSDVRYKKNITTLEESLDKVLNLRGVRFDLIEEPNSIDGKGRYIGFIAQELEKEYPEFVVTEKDGYKSVAYDKINAVLVEAIKAQQKEIASQNEKIDRLEKIVQEMQATMERTGVK